ncbi:MAG TPA: FAD-dependent oxidoreductase [Thermosynechococcaceae cyanobacterium]
MQNLRNSDYDAVVIGAGFYGCQVALYLKQYLNKILVLEQETEGLQRASYVNQARVHNGYHYPRSLLTAFRSRVNFSRFTQEYCECIDSSFDKYYAIAKKFSKVNGRQFQLFCERIGAPIEPAEAEVRSLFNPHLIEQVFRTQEYAFNSVKLKHRLLNELEMQQVEVITRAQALRVSSTQHPQIDLCFRSHQQIKEITTGYVFNCTYSGINEVLEASNLPTIPLKHELTEMALIDVPAPLKTLGITVMCGPFFSLMPFPSRNLHSLSHVRYTPHCYWQDTEQHCEQTKQHFDRSSRQTNYRYMIKDATRYMPILEDCSYVDSVWDVKTVLPQSEVDDSRPILFERSDRLNNLISILGGKIDNIYDVLKEIQILSAEFKPYVSF